MKSKEQSRVLVCITPQANSTRLIDAGQDLAVQHSCELHILHIEKGNNIFFTEDSARLLEELFSYASRLDGNVHAVCGENVLAEIKKFIKAKDITHLVLGTPPEGAIASENVIEHIHADLPFIELTLVRHGAD